jgi:hypothetical protein
MFRVSHKSSRDIKNLKSAAIERSRFGVCNADAVCFCEVGTEVIHII